MSTSWDRGFPKSNLRWLWFEYFLQSFIHTAGLYFRADFTTLCLNRLRR